MRTTDSTDPAPLVAERVAPPPGGASDGATPEAPPVLPGVKRIRGSLVRLSFWSAVLFPGLYVALLLPGTVATRELLLLGLLVTHVLTLLGGRSYPGSTSS